MSTVHEIKAAEERFRSLPKHIQEDLEKCPYYQTFRDAFELLSKPDIKSVMSDIESGKIKVEPYAGENIPEVGEVCEISWRSGPVVKRAEITYMGEGVGCYKDPQEDGREFTFAFDAVQFYPINSEREMCIQEMLKHQGIPKANIDAYMTFAENLYDAGYRLTEGV